MGFDTLRAKSDFLCLSELWIAFQKIVLWKMLYDTRVQKPIQDLGLQDLGQQTSHSSRINFSAQ